MQLIAGRTAQEYNHRKRRQGAFWEDRYHATVIEIDEYLKSLSRLYRSKHGSRRRSEPSLEWADSGYREIRELPKRYAIIDLRALNELCGFGELADFQRAQRQWIEEALAARGESSHGSKSNSTCLAARV